MSNYRVYIRQPDQLGQDIPNVAVSGSAGGLSIWDYFPNTGEVFGTGGLILTTPTVGISGSAQAKLPNSKSKTNVPNNSNSVNSNNSNSVNSNNSNTGVYQSLEDLLGKAGLTISAATILIVVVLMLKKR